MQPLALALRTASRLSGLPQRVLVRLLEDGRLRGRCVLGVWVVEPESLRALVRGEERARVELPANVARLVK